jgi:hypothetical protein
MIWSARACLLIAAFLSIAQAQRCPEVPRQKQGLVSVAVDFAGDENTASQPVVVPTASLSITTTGHPVFIALVPDNAKGKQPPVPYTTVSAGISKAHPFSNWTITILRDSNFAVVAATSGAASSHNEPATMEIPISLDSLDSPAAGQHVYTIRVQATQGAFAMKGARLIAYEF